MLKSLLHEIIKLLLDVTITEFTHPVCYYNNLSYLSAQTFRTTILLLKSEIMRSFSFCGTITKLEIVLKSPSIFLISLLFFIGN